MDGRTAVQGGRSFRSCEFGRFLSLIVLECQGPVLGITAKDHIFVQLDNHGLMFTVCNNPNVAVGELLLKAFFCRNGIACKIFRLADDGFGLLEAVDSPAVAFNVDAGNIVSLCPDVDPIEQAIAMLQGAQHCHLKDLQVRDGEVHFTAMGDGQLNYVPMLKELEARAIPCSLEIPLRMHRQRDSYPVRGDSPVDPARSLEVLIQSREMLEKWLGYPLQER